MFILGTSSVLGLIPIDQIDLIAPIPQVLSVGFRPLGSVRWVAPVTILVLLTVRIAQASVMFTGITRLPMVAGWDGLLPRWFTELHAGYRTPVNSIVFVGVMTFIFSLAGLIGVGQQEGFQLLWNASAIFYALTYLVMFALPIAGLRQSGARAPIWLKLAAVSGFGMGLTIGEIFFLDDLADDCARDGVWEFFFVAPPLPFTGAVGSPINPLAIK